MKGIRMYKYMNISTCVYKNVYINVLTVHVYYTYIHTLYVRISGRSLIYIFMYVCACMTVCTSIMHMDIRKYNSTLYVGMVPKQTAAYTFQLQVMS